MADIELVVKIPERVYNALTHTEFDANLVVNEMRKSIANGTPLPKGHGDLIDREMLMDNGYQMEPVEMWYGIKHADTIIEADKAESEE